MPVLHQHEECPESPASGAAGQLECEIVTEFERLQQLAPAWDRLWHCNPRAEIFQTFIWARAWWQSFGDAFKLCVPVVYEAGEVALILPLVQRRGVLQFLGLPQSDYADMLCSHNNERPEQLLSVALWALLQSAPNWKECILGALRPDSHVVGAWGKLPHELRRLLQLEVTYTCPTILLGEKRTEVLKSLLANKHVHRRLQKLKKAGLVTFRHFESRAEAQQQLTQFFQCHMRRCALRSKTSCFEDPRMRSLMRALVDQLDLQQELRFGALELNGRALAWSFGFQVHGKYAYYQQTFDVDAEEYAPGDVLLHHLLSYAKENVEKEVDFLRGNEFWKKRFATHISRNRSLYLQRPGIRGRLRRVRWSIQGRLFGPTSRIKGFVLRHETLFRSMSTWRRKVLRRLRRARKNGELTDYLLGSWFDLVRNIVWSKRAATFFQMEPDTCVAAMPECLRGDATINIRRGRFSDLADLALEYPEVSFPAFREYRDRLKRGDQVYLVREDDELALVAWTGARPVGQVSTITNVSSNTADQAAVAMYECWPIRDPSAACARLLAMLTTEAANAGLLVCCPALPAAHRLELRRHGFLPRSRVAGSRILHWLRHDSVREYPMVDEQPSPEDSSCPRLKGKFKL